MFAIMLATETGLIRADSRAFDTRHAASLAAADMIKADGNLYLVRKA